MIGARILGPDAAKMIMEPVMAVRFGMTTREVATLIHPHMGLSDAIKRTAHAFRTTSSAHFESPHSSAP
ncbi:MAG: hypothetical protein ACNA8W_14930 [Bradymonadaceae bacterium]